MRQNLYPIAILSALMLAGAVSAEEIKPADCIPAEPTLAASTQAALNSQDVLNLLQSDDPTAATLALTALHRAAGASEPWALRQLSTMYQTGTSVEARPDCVRLLLAGAAETGDVSSQIDLANLLVKGTPAPADITQAQELLDQAAKSDDPWTLINIANSYTTGDGMPVDAQKAIVLYERAASLHNDAALVQLGSLYKAGLGDVPADPAKAAAYFAQAAEAGDNAARVNLALMLMAGTPTLDNKRALDLLDAAVADKDVWATTLLAGLYTAGRIVPADGAQAVKLLQPLADAGNAAALTGLGDVYSHGAGTITADARLARSLYEQAAALGDLGAKNKLGLILVDPQTAQPDPQRGLALLEEVADAGDGWANMQVGDLYAAGKVVKPDADEALRRYRMAVDAGVASGLVRISGLYKTGLGTLKADPAKEMDYLEQAVALGDNGGRVMLAQALLDKTPEDVARAVDLLQAAADTGDVWSSTLLAGLYTAGTKVPADGDKAVALLQPLADAHVAAAIAGLGDVYAKGAGDIAADPRHAMDLYQTAAAAGDVGAKNKLGLMLVDPAGLAPDVPRGLALLKDVAEHGDGWAMIQTGDVLASGKGVPVDGPLAVSYFKRAADAGISAGLVRLGGVYKDGLGTVEADPGAAADYYEQAIARDDNVARISLALMLLPDGRKADQERAVGLLTDAAAKDDVWALTILADLYANGRQIKPDYRAAMGYLDRLLDLGQDAANLQVGLALASGPLAGDHAKEGVALIRKAVAEDVPNAMAELARLQGQGKVAGDNGTDAEKNLLAEVDRGNPTALRYLLQLYRSGGARFPARISSAQKLLQAKADMLTPEAAAFEAISLAALRSPTPDNLRAIGANFAKLGQADIPQTLQVLFWTNKNAYVYILQQHMKQRGQYQGSLSGMLTRQTISAISNVCRQVARREECGQGPLTPNVAVLLSNYLATAI